MFILNTIETLSPDLLNLPENTQHILTFKAMFTILEVPDSFTGTVFQQDNELQLQHFNNPKGNKRKVITLKNKLKPGAFEQFKQQVFALCRDEPVCYPLSLEVQLRKSRKPGA